MSTKKIYETGTLELIGKDEAVAVNDWCVEASFTLPVPDSNGQVLGITLNTRKDDATGGTGTILLPSGRLMVFDSAPSITVGDAALASGVHETVLGSVAIANGDWYTDTMGSIVTKETLIPFYSLKTLYFAFYYTLATGMNSAAGDDEIMEMTAQIELEA